MSILRGSLFLLLLAGASLWVGPTLMRPDMFDGDAAHHIFWLYRYVDPALFPGDITVDYLRTSAPIGYRALYASLSPMLDPVITSKWISALLFAMSGWLAWRIGRVSGGPDQDLRGVLTASALLVLMAFSPQTDMLSTMGMQRAFGLPITLMTLLGLASGRYLLVGLSWILAALFYPVLLPVLGLSAGLVWLRDIWVTRRMPANWLLNVLAALVAVALALWGTPDAGILGPSATYAQAIAMPEFGAGGRLDLWGAGEPGVAFWHNMTGLGWRPHVLLGIALAAVLVIWQRQIWLIPFAAWSMAITGLGLWLLLRTFPTVFMFGLYLPNRHPRWAVAAFGAVTLAAAAYVVYGWIVRKATPVVQSRLRAGVMVIATAVAVGSLVPNAARQLNAPPDEDLQRVYAWLGAQPPNTLVAAHPDIADYIPLFSRRSVLASTETSMPWMLGYYEQVRPRLEASLRAAYATSVSEMDRVLAPYHVQVFVTGPQAWSRVHYLQPQDALVQQLWRRGLEQGFALKTPPPERVLFSSGSYAVVRVETVQ